MPPLPVACSPAFLPGLDHPDVTADDGDSGGVMKSERQQDEVACGGDNGRAGVVIMAAESRADVGRLGSLNCFIYSKTSAFALNQFRPDTTA